MSKPKIIAVVGPTASGKTALAIKLAKIFKGEIISADSRQIYRGMDIGTAKPSRNELAVIPHHLIDIKNPDEDYTVAEYKKDALAAARKILNKGKLPILIGGTGLYVKALVDNLSIPKIKADEKLRARLENELKEGGLASLFQKLVSLDPEAAYIVDPKNPRRVVRALEIAIKTGKPFSAQRKTGKPIFDPLIIGLNPPEEKLFKKIDGRVDEMVRAGLVSEVKKMIRKYGVRQKALEAIGYREIIDHLNGKIALNEAVALIKKNTHAYAKRQMTWFRKDKRTKWANKKTAVGLVKEFLFAKNPITMTKKARL